MTTSIPPKNANLLLPKKRQNHIFVNGSRKDWADLSKVDDNGVALARHHIIGMSRLKLLWKNVVENNYNEPGKEDKDVKAALDGLVATIATEASKWVIEPSLKNHLKKNALEVFSNELCSGAGYKHSENDPELAGIRLFARFFAWIPGNIFVGPDGTYRFDDPEGFRRNPGRVAPVWSIPGQNASGQVDHPTCSERRDAVYEHCAKYIVGTVLHLQLTNILANIYAHSSAPKRNQASAVFALQELRSIVCEYGAPKPLDVKEWKFCRDQFPVGANAIANAGGYEIIHKKRIPEFFSDERPVEVLEVVSEVVRSSENIEESGGSEIPVGTRSLAFRIGGTNVELSVLDEEDQRIVEHGRVENINAQDIAAWIRDNWVPDFPAEFGQVTMRAMSVEVVSSRFGRSFELTIDIGFDIEDTPVILFLNVRYAGVRRSFQLEGHIGFPVVIDGRETSMWFHGGFAEDGKLSTQLEATWHAVGRGIQLLEFADVLGLGTINTDDIPEIHRQTEITEASIVLDIVRKSYAVSVVVGDTQLAIVTTP